MSLAIGQQLDQFALMERVGQGGMAIVYRGQDTRLGRSVAVKVLHDHLAESLESRERFEREAKAVAKLRHRNILEIYGFSGANSDCSYIVTEYIDGPTLAEFCDNYTLRHPEVAAMITLQIAQALGHAHSQGIVHRDVKPENMMVRRDGIIKLTDFGIAHMIDLQRMTMTGQLLGSPAYMSPEHMTGVEIDHRADIFALGIVLYQLMCGDLPFSGRNPHEVLRKIADTNYRDPSLVNPKVCKHLQRIVSKALSQRREDRYQTAGLFAADLQRFLNDSGLEDVDAELQRFFDTPASYEVALQKRLVQKLYQRGQKALPKQKGLALEAFSRVLTLEPKHAGVTNQLRTFQSKQRRQKTGLAVLSIVLLSAGANSIWQRQRTKSAKVDRADSIASVRSDSPTPDKAPGPLSPLESVIKSQQPSDPVPIIKKNLLGSATTQQGSPPQISTPTKKPGLHQTTSTKPTTSTAPTRPKRTKNAPSPSKNITARVVRVSVFPANSEVRVDSGPWQKVPGRFVDVAVTQSSRTVSARNRCCQSTSAPITKDNKVMQLSLRWLPARIKPTCDKPNTSVRVNGKPAAVGQYVTVPIVSSYGTRNVEVVFANSELGRFRKRVKVRYHDSQVIECAFSVPSLP